MTRSDIPANMDISGKLLSGAYDHFSNMASSVERGVGQLAGMDKDKLDYTIKQGNKTNQIFAHQLTFNHTSLNL